MLAILGIILLSCIPLSVIGGTKPILVRIDIVMPQTVGREEINDITFIQKTLRNYSSDINVFFERKVLGNNKVVLVLEIKELCRWSSITSAFSRQGYQISATPLEGCNEYAKDINACVEVNYDHPDDFVNDTVIENFEVVYYNEGVNDVAYLGVLRDHFEKNKDLQDAGRKFACYKALGDLPVKIMYFSVLTNGEMEGIYQKVQVEGTASIEMDMLQSFSSFTESC